MNGCVIPRTPIAVDFWKVRDCPHAKCFFLTHLHGDHVVGLTSSWQHHIYCSCVTAKLLIANYNIAADLVTPLTIGDSHIVYLDSDHSQQMTVTLIDSNHCPGSVMFVFEGYFGTILHTGDFRFHPDLLDAHILKKLASCMDTLYLDNTYCSPQCDFPTRDHVVHKIIELVTQHPNHNIVFGIRTLGKEDLLVRIAQETQEWISVPASLYSNLEILQYPKMFRRMDSSCRLRVEPFMKVTRRSVEKWNQTYPTIAILPTALYTGLPIAPPSGNNLFVLPYSDHSSYVELHHFVGFLKPKKVIPVVSGKARGPFGVSVADRADMSCFVDLLNKYTPKEFDVPESVRQFMHAANVTHTPSKKRKRVKNQHARKHAQMGVVFDQSENTEDEGEERSALKGSDHRVIFISQHTKQKIGKCKSQSVFSTDKVTGSPENWPKVTGCQKTLKDENSSVVCGIQQFHGSDVKEDKILVKSIDENVQFHMTEKGLPTQTGSDIIVIDSDNDSLNFDEKSDDVVYKSDECVTSCKYALGSSNTDKQSKSGQVDITAYLQKSSRFAQSQSEKSVYRTCRYSNVCESGLEQVREVLCTKDRPAVGDHDTIVIHDSDSESEDMDCNCDLDTTVIQSTTRQMVPEQTDLDCQSTGLSKDTDHQSTNLSTAIDHLSTNLSTTVNHQSKNLNKALDYESAHLSTVVDCQSTELNPDVDHKLTDLNPDMDHQSTDLGKVIDHQLVLGAPDCRDKMDQGCDHGSTQDLCQMSDNLDNDQSTHLSTSMDHQSTNLSTSVGHQLTHVSTDIGHQSLVVEDDSDCPLVLGNLDQSYDNGSETSTQDFCQMSDNLGNNPNINLSRKKCMTLSEFLPMENFKVVHLTGRSNFKKRDLYRTIDN